MRLPGVVLTSLRIPWEQTEREKKVASCSITTFCEAFETWSGGEQRQIQEGLETRLIFVYLILIEWIRHIKGAVVVVSVEPVGNKTSLLQSTFQKVQ